MILFWDKYWFTYMEVSASSCNCLLHSSDISESRIVIYIFPFDKQGYLLRNGNQSQQTLILPEYRGQMLHPMFLLFQLKLPNRELQQVFLIQKKLIQLLKNSWRSLTFQTVNMLLSQIIFMFQKLINLGFALEVLMLILEWLHTTPTLLNMTKIHFLKLLRRLKK